MALTWTCDKCEQPNFMTTMYCSRCGAKRPDRYGLLLRLSKCYINLWGEMLQERTLV